MPILESALKVMILLFLWSCVFLFFL
jgi:hypothetical protein